MVNREKTSLLMWTLMILVVACAYFALLVPYVVHANLSHSGLVISSEDISADQLPGDVRQFIVFHDKLAVLLIKQQKPIWLGRPAREWTIALVTNQKVPPGTFIEFNYPVAQMYVDWRDYPFGQFFDQLVISDLVRPLSQFEIDIEHLLSSNFGTIVFQLSVADYYFGPFLFAAIALVFKKRPTLWSILMIPWCYSFETLVYNTLAASHNNYVPSELSFFGYLFLPLTPVLLLVWAYERSAAGRAVAEQLFKVHKKEA